MRTFSLGIRAGHCDAAAQTGTGWVQFRVGDLGPDVWGLGVYRGFLQNRVLLGWELIKNNPQILNPKPQTMRTLATGDCSIPRGSRGHLSEKTPTPQKTVPTEGNNTGVRLGGPPTQ